MPYLINVRAPLSAVLVLAACVPFPTPGDSDGDPPESTSGDEPDTGTAPTTTDGLCPDGECTAFELEQMWSWAGGEVSTIPLVVDLDGDGVVEVVVNSKRVDGEDDDIGELLVLDGPTGALRWRISDLPKEGRFGSQGRATVAVGDVSGDGLPDIVYAGRVGEEPGDRSQIHAVDGAGEWLWSSLTPTGDPATIRVANGAIVLANLDDDPQAEVVIGAAVLDHDGLLLWDQDDVGGEFGVPKFDMGANAGQPIYPGSLAAVIDLTGDGAPEILSGRDAWTIDWHADDPPQVTLTKLWTDTSGMGNDGWPAVADLDLDGLPEVVLVAWPEVRILDGATGLPWCVGDATRATCDADPAQLTAPAQIPGGHLGGPAAIADFDGDGRPEIVVSGGAALGMLDLVRPGEQFDPTLVKLLPGIGQTVSVWESKITDASSGSNGAAAFDFDGDGAAEVIAQDECWARIYDGRTGGLRARIEVSSGTIHEYPVIADLDADGDADMLVVSNLGAPQVSNNPCTTDPAYQLRMGVFAYTSAGLPWAPARPLWTQHTYRVSNADDNGNPPMAELSPWEVAGLNSFRRNVAP